MNRGSNLLLVFCTSLTKGSKARVLVRFQGAQKESLRSPSQHPPSKAIPVERAAWLASPTTVSFLRKICHQSAFLNASLFYWAGGVQGSVKQVQSRARQAQFYVNVLYSVVYAIFVLVRCIQVQLGDAYSPTIKTFMKFQGVYYTLLSTLTVAVAAKGQEIAALLNGILDFAREAEGKYIVVGGRKPRITGLFDIIFTWLYYEINSMTALIMIGGAILADMPYLPSSLLRDPHGISVGRVLCTLCMLYVHWIYIAAAHFTFYSCLLIGPPLMILLKGMSDPDCEVTGPNLRQFPGKIRVYRNLRVLMKVYNECVNIFLPPFKVALIALIVFCTYGAIRFKGPLAFGKGILGAFCMVLLVAVFTCLSELHARSSNLLDIWRREVGGCGGSVSATSLVTPNKLIKKQIAAMRELKATVGSCYYVDREMVGTMIMTIIDETVTFLCVNP